MRTPLIPLLAMSTALAAFTIGCGCGEESTTNTSTNNSATNPAGTIQADGNNTGTNSSTGATGSTAQADNALVATDMEGNPIVINGAKPGTPVYNERFSMSRSVRGYKAQLKAELEAVRARLNDGTRPEAERKNDQDRAADLAQGLERMDRLIAAVETSDDLTWTSIRESSLKEAEEVRVWSEAHGYKKNA